MVALAAFTGLLAGACSRQPPEPTADGGTQLTPGLVEIRSLASGESKLYRAVLAADEVLHMRVEQRGLDVEIRFPDGERTPIDLRYGDRVCEELWWLTEKTRELRIELGTSDGGGDYRLTVEKLGPASEIDRRRVEAFRRTQEGMSQIDDGHPKAARASLEAAVELWRGTETPVCEGLAWGELGWALFELDDHEGTVKAFDRALALLEPTPELALLGRFHDQRGRAYKAIWKFDLAESDYRAGQALAEEVGDAYGQALATNDLAVLDHIRGKLKPACDGYARASQLFHDSGFSEAATAQLNRGRCYMKLGTLPEALPSLLAALQAAEELDEATELRAKALREIGWWHRLEDQPQEALVYLRQALELQPDLRGIRDRLGTVHADLGELDTARDYYAQALEEARGNALEEAYVRANLCRLEELAGRIAAGRKQCRMALEFLEDLGATGTTAHVLQLSARLERQHDLRAAEDLAARALRLIESQRPLAGDPQPRIAFLAERLGAHRLVIDLRMELDLREPEAGWDARALEVSELTRARSLLDLLSAEEVVPAPAGDPFLHRKEQELLERIDRQARDLAVRMLTEERPVAGVEQVLAALEEQLAAIRLELRHLAPSYVALAQPQPLDIPEIQRLLDDETLLLVYHLGEQTSYLWTVSRSQVGSRRLASRSDLESLAERWYGLLADPGRRWTAGETERRCARQLSRQLLEPIADELPRWHRLAVVADGALLRLPFAALPSPENERPLIADHEVVSLPSAAVLAVLREQTAGRRGAAGLLAVVADPVYEPDDERLTHPSADAPPEPHYNRLPGSAGEARDLLELAAGRTLLLESFEARRDRVMAGALEDYRILHFATHAQTAASSTYPLGLVLSRFDETGREGDGTLGLQELYRLHLPAELAVLSACGTALGEGIEGEGLIGLSRGFMHAGTPRVVVSLWAVRDRATRELMRRFYRALLHDRARPAEALRRAQAAMWRDGRPTYQWAAFVLQGDWRPFPVTVSSDRVSSAPNVNKAGDPVSEGAKPASPAPRHSRPTTNRPTERRNP